MEFIANKIVCGVLTFLVLSLVECSEEEHYCDMQSTRIQIAFVMDKTGTFGSSIKKFAEVAAQLSKDFETSYPGSEFAFVAFSDYPASAGIVDEPRLEHSGVEDCYEPRMNFTQNIPLLKSAIEGTQTKDGGLENSESSLSAITFTAASKSLGWVAGKRDKNGIYVHKIIVFATDEISTRILTKTEGRERPKLDGSDKCATSLPPTNYEIERLFMEKDISVIGLYVRGRTGTLDTAGYYHEIFHPMRHAISYSAYSLTNLKDVAQIKNSITAGIRNNIECIDPDPPAYNTLGY